MQPRFRVVILAREAQVLRDLRAVAIRVGVDRGLAEGGLFRAPDDGLGSVGQEPCGVQVVGVDVIGAIGILYLDRTVVAGQIRIALLPRAAGAVFPQLRGFGLAGVSEERMNTGA